MSLFTEWEGMIPDPDDPEFETLMVDLFNFFIGIPVEANAVTPEAFFSVQSSISDTTAGRVMINGAGGWHGNVATTANDADTATYGGMFMTADLSAATNWPSWFGSGPGSLLVVTGQNTNNFTQVAFAQNAGIAPAYRNYRASAFGSWVRLVTLETLLGIVSQSGGVPTGAVIEAGSNANGQYVRFADGTQFCMVSNLSMSTVTTAIGAGYRSDSDTVWTFPAAFASAKVYSVFGSTNNAARWLSFSSLGNAGVSVRQLAFTSFAGGEVGYICAIGRWF